MQTFVDESAGVSCRISNLVQEMVMEKKQKKKKHAVLDFTLLTERYRKNWRRISRGNCAITMVIHLVRDLFLWE